MEKDNKIKNKRNLCMLDKNKKRGDVRNGKR